MTGESVLNKFEQPGSDLDNTLVLDGTLNVNGTATVDGVMTVGGTLQIDGSLNSATGADLKTKLVTVPIGDVSTAGSVFAVPGVAGTIVKISNVIDTTITTANAGLTFEIDGNAVTDAAITIEFSGSLPGDVDQSTPSALNVITAAEAIEVVKDGLSTVASNGVVTFEILPS